MIRPPVVLGLTLCEDVVADHETGNVSVIRAFTGFGLETFPSAVPPFCAFAALTAGEGDATFRLEVVWYLGPLEPEVVHELHGKLHFQDPLKTVNWIVRLSRCRFPEEGRYVFTLWIDDEWMAQRVLRVHSKD